jgi:hypothetical protein
MMAPLVLAQFSTRLPPKLLDGRADGQERDDDRSCPVDRGSTVCLRSVDEPARHPTAPRGHERERDERDTCERDQNRGRDCARRRILGVLVLLGVRGLFGLRLRSGLFDRLGMLARAFFAVRFGREADAEGRRGDGHDHCEERHGHCTAACRWPAACLLSAW